jgi:5-methyltetrahydrofolate--homocysteine methyltransferase
LWFDRRAGGKEDQVALLGDIRGMLIAGRDTEVGVLTRKALEDGLPAATILGDGLLAGMDVVGERFRDHHIFLPDVLLAARALYAGLDLLEPHLEGGELPHRGTVVIGSVEGDLHDIGKNLVGIMLRGGGYNVVDLGHSVSAGAFVEAAREHQAAVVGMSALLTTTMPEMPRVVRGLQDAGLSNVKVIVGGAPVSEGFAREIGAHAYGFDAARAVEVVREWLP